MHSISHRLLTLGEAKQLEVIASRPLRLALNAIQITSLYSLPFLGTVFLLSERWPEHEQLAQAAYGFIAIWAAFGLIRGIKRRWADAEPARRDLAEGRIELHRFKCDAALALSDSQEDAPAFILHLNDGRALLVHGRCLSDLHRQRRFPSTEFVFSRTPSAHRFVAVEAIGTYLEPRLSQVEAMDLDLIDGDSPGGFDLLKLDFESLKINSAVDLHEAIPQHHRPRAAWLSPELMLAFVGSIIHVGLAAHTWRITNETVNVYRDASFGEPCVPGKTVADPRINTCQILEYPVLGTTTGDIWQSLQANTPLRKADPTGTRFDIYLSGIGLNPFLEWITEPAGAKQCRIKKINSYLQFQYMMPKWLDRQKAPAELLNRYVQWEQANWAFLRELVQIELDGIKAFEQAAVALPPDACDVIELRARAMGGEALARSEVRRKALYEDSSNPITQAASADWMKPKG